MNNKIFWVSLFGLLLLTSCASRKNIVYLQDMQIGEKYRYDTRYEAVIRRDDRLSITVSNKKPELAIPFNIYGGTFKVGTDGDVTADASTRVNEKGYRVDVDGDIDFPILGILHVEGLTVSELRDERELYERPAYIYRVSELQIHGAGSRRPQRNIFRRWRPGHLAGSHRQCRGPDRQGTHRPGCRHP